MKKIIKIIIVVGIMVLTLCACPAINQKNEEKRLAKEAAVQAEIERLEIEEVLMSHTYGAELRVLYEQYPQMRKMLLNIEMYPENVIEFFLTHPEAVDWTVNYPENMEKTEEEQIAAALEPIKEDEPCQNGIPLLYQWDERWGYLQYNVGTIATEGCGPTCLSMIAIGLTGDRSITPKVVADMSLANGYYTEQGGSTWSLMEKGAAKLGIVGTQVMEWNAAAVAAQLRAGKPMVFSLGPGDFTMLGHFIVVSGINEDGTVMVNDPNSKMNSQKSWEIQTILEQAKGMWAFTLP